MRKQQTIREQNELARVAVIERETTSARYSYLMTTRKRTRILSSCRYVVYAGHFDV